MPRLVACLLTAGALALLAGCGDDPRGAREATDEPPATPRPETGPATKIEMH